jgi:DNA-binding MarR family transcriptional regulator
MADTVKEPRQLTEKSVMVVAFLQENEGAHFGDEIAAATGLNPKGIHGVLNALWKREFVSKEKVLRDIIVTDAEGNEKPAEKEYTAYSLTDLGMDYVIEA